MVRRRAGARDARRRQDGAHRHRLPRRARALHDRQRQPRRRIDRRSRCATGRSATCTANGASCRSRPMPARSSSSSPTSSRRTCSSGPWARCSATSRTRSSTRSCGAPRPSIRGDRERHRRLGDAASCRMSSPSSCRAGATVADAVARSGLVAHYGLDLAALAVRASSASRVAPTPGSPTAIGSKSRGRSLADPKVARARRARAKPLARQGAPAGRARPRAIAAAPARELARRGRIADNAPVRTPASAVAGTSSALLAACRRLFAAAGRRAGDAGAVRSRMRRPRR